LSGQGKLADWLEQDSTVNVVRRFAPELNDIKRADLASMSREELEDLAWRFRDLARSIANRADQDSSTSSRPPSSDDPYRRQERGKPDVDASETALEQAGKPDKNTTGKSAGKQPGAKGHWRSQPIVVSAQVEHAPQGCAACRSALGPEVERRCVSAHNSLELVRADMALQVTATRHSYFAMRCPCGHDNAERPRVRLSSLIEGRKRNLRMSERHYCANVRASHPTTLDSLKPDRQLNRNSRVSPDLASIDHDG
jgi:transposase